MYNSMENYGISKDGEDRMRMQRIRKEAALRDEKIKDLEEILLRQSDDFHSNWEPHLEPTAGIPASSILNSSPNRWRPYSERAMRRLNTGETETGPISPGTRKRAQKWSELRSRGLSRSQELNIAEVFERLSEANGFFDRKDLVDAMKSLGITQVMAGEHVTSIIGDTKSDSVSYSIFRDIVASSLKYAKIVEVFHHYASDASSPRLNRRDLAKALSEIGVQQHYLKPEHQELWDDSQLDSFDFDTFLSIVLGSKYLTPDDDDVVWDDSPWELEVTRLEREFFFFSRIFAAKKEALEIIQLPGGRSQISRGLEALNALECEVSEAESALRDLRGSVIESHRRRWLKRVLEVKDALKTKAAMFKEATKSAELWRARTKGSTSPSKGVDEQLEVILDNERGSGMAGGASPDRMPQDSSRVGVPRSPWTRYRRSILREIPHELSPTRPGDEEVDLYNSQEHQQKAAADMAALSPERETHRLEAPTLMDEMSAKLIKAEGLLVETKEDAALKADAAVLDSERRIGYLNLEIKSLKEQLIECDCVAEKLLKEKGYAQAQVLSTAVTIKELQAQVDKSERQLAECNIQAVEREEDVAKLIQGQVEWEAERAEWVKMTMETDLLAQSFMEEKDDWENQKEMWQELVTEFKGLDGRSEEKQSQLEAQCEALQEAVERRDQLVRGLKTRLKALEEEYMEGSSLAHEAQRKLQKDLLKSKSALSESREEADKAEESLEALVPMADAAGKLEDALLLATTSLDEETAVSEILRSRLEKEIGEKGMLVEELMVLKVDYQAQKMYAEAAGKKLDSYTETVEKKLEDSNKIADERLEKSKKESNQVIAELYGELEVAQGSLKSTRNKLAMNETTLRNEINGLIEEVRNLHDDLASVQDELDMERTKVATEKSKNKDLKQERDAQKEVLVAKAKLAKTKVSKESEAQIESLNEEVVSLHDDLASLQDELEAERNKVATEKALTKRLTEKEGSVAKAETAKSKVLNEAEAQIESLNKDMVHLQDDLASLQDELQAERTKLAIEKAKTKHLTKEMKTAEQELESARVLTKFLESQVNEGNAKSETLEDQIGELRASLEVHVAVVEREKLELKARVDATSKLTRDETKLEYLKTLKSTAAELNEKREENEKLQAGLDWACDNLALEKVKNSTKKKGDGSPHGVAITSSIEMKSDVLSPGSKEMINKIKLKTKRQQIRRTVAESEAEKSATLVKERQVSDGVASNAAKRWAGATGVALQDTPVRKAVALAKERRSGGGVATAGVLKWAGTSGVGLRKGAK